MKENNEYISGYKEYSPFGSHERSGQRIVNVMMLRDHFLPGNVEAATFYQHRVQIKERMCAADKNKSEIIIIMVPKRIKTNALRNLVDARSIFLLNCTCTAIKAQHPQWRSEHLALKTGAVRTFEILIQQCKKSTATIIVTSQLCLRAVTMATDMDENE